MSRNADRHHHDDPTRITLLEEDVDEIEDKWSTATKAVLAIIVGTLVGLGSALANGWIIHT